MNITASCVGNYGRFGNSLFQAAFAMGYAKKYNLTLQLPKNWIGRKIFNLSHIPEITEKYPSLGFDKIPNGQSRIDLYGYYQNQESVNFYTKQDLEKWFTFQDRWCENIEKPKDSYSTAHLRLGDYKSLKHVYCIVSKNSYLKACEKYHINIDELIWLTEENESKNTLANREGVGFLNDFLTMVWSDAILRGNSTFSWWAAALSDAKVYSPVVNNLIGENDVEFVEGNYPKMFSGFTDLHLKHDEIN
jgi:hypothetical protein